MKIGNIEIKGRVILAPMAGYTSKGYRDFMNKFGTSLCYTEMVSDMGIIYGNKETATYIDFKKSNVPTGVQLFGHDPECLKKALLICEKTNPNIDFFDINMACPVNKVTKTGAGSSLLKSPQKCGEIIKILKSVTNKPITAKIRLGWDSKSINYLEVIKELESAGVDMIAIHARTAKELYTGSPHFDLINNLRSSMSVPLVVSGNIYTVEDAVKAMKITGADAVMVARGGVGNPLLITNINNYFNNKELVVPSLKEQIDYCKELANELIKEKGEFLGMRVFRSMSSKFFINFPNSKQIRGRLASEVSTYDELCIILSEYYKSLN